MTTLLDNINVKVSRQFVLNTVRPFGKILLAPTACRTAPMPARNTQRQTTHAHAQRPRANSALTSANLPPRNLKTEPKSHHQLLNPQVKDLNASLIQPIKDSNGGKHVLRRRMMMWVEKGRGE